MSDFNLAYPVARGTAPVLVLLLAALAGGETIRPGAAAGVTNDLPARMPARLSCPTSRSSGRGFLGDGRRYFIAIYTVVDGLGARLLGDPIG